MAHLLHTHEALSSDPQNPVKLDTAAQTCDPNQCSVVRWASEKGDFRGSQSASLQQETSVSNEVEEVVL